MDIAQPELTIVINWSFLKTEKHLHGSESVTVPEISFRVLGASQLRVPGLMSLLFEIPTSGYL